MTVEEAYASDKPIYLQIMARMCRAMVRGDLATGERLPSVRQAALEYQVNPNTMQRVYGEMERRGLVETRRGQGTFVTDSKDRIEALRETLKRDAIESLVQELVAMGLSRGEITGALQAYLRDMGHEEEGDKS